MDIAERFDPFVVRHNDAATQASSLAVNIAARLRAAINAKGSASIAFSGGGTPALMFEQLAREALDWSKVDITLVDERCVAQTDERSNAGMLKAKLVDRLPAEPRFLPLFIEGESDGDRDARLTAFPRPFDVVHLGMGEDAHTASFFPDAPNIADMLNTENPDLWLSTQSASSREERVTWTLTALLQSKYIVLQTVGERKRSVLSGVLEKLASGATDATQCQATPVLAILAHTNLINADGISCHIFFASE